MLNTSCYCGSYSSLAVGGKAPSGQCTLNCPDGSGNICGGVKCQPSCAYYITIYNLTTNSNLTSNVQKGTQSQSL